MDSSVMKLSLSAGPELALNKAQIKLLESDPVGTAKRLKLPQVCQIIRWSNRLYREGKSVITDNAFDALEDELRVRKPSHPLLKKIGAAPVVVKGGSRKVPLPYPMFSLAKIKPGTGNLERWHAQNGGPYCASDKLDGNSIEIVYTDNGIKIYTRGNGTVGQDISHIAPHLDIPARVPIKGLAVRGEAIMPPSVFKQFADKYDNPRNLVAGALNKRETHAALPHIHFVAYEIIEPRKFRPSQAFAKLKQLGFKIPFFQVLPTIDGVTLSNLLTSRKAKSKYEIDGLVIETDVVNRRPPAGTHDPDYAVAFKMTSDDDIKAVKVLNVTWQESKHSSLTPVVEVEPTKLAGVTIKRVTGHNGFFIVNGFLKGEVGIPVRPIGPGALVKLTRSGDVIPHILEVLKGAKAPALPKVPFVWDGVKIVLKEQTSVGSNKKLAAFFGTTGIDFIKLGTVQKLVDVGLDSVERIIKAKPSDFLQAEGIQERGAQKLYDAIQAKIKNIQLPTLMDASGVFASGVGTRRAAMVIKAYPNILEMANEPKAQLVQKLMGIQGFGSIAATQFAEGLPKFVIWLKKTGIVPAVPKVVKPSGSKCKGLNVCFTGVRDSALEADIVKEGGAIAGGVNAKTTTLLCKDPNSGSSKNAKAQQLGIPIMTLAQFKAQYKL